MARHYNRVILIGNIGSEIDVGDHGGTTRVSFDMAVNRNYQQDGEWQEETTWINDLTIWQYGAQIIRDRHSKGDRVFIEGRLRTDEWEKDGTTYTKLSVTGERVVPMAKNTEDGNGDGRSSSSSSSGDSSDSGGSGSADDLLDDPGGQETEDDIPF